MGSGASRWPFGSGGLSPCCRRVVGDDWISFRRFDSQIDDLTEDVVEMAS